MPGVSTNTTWASSRVRTPRTCERVVCGLSETMETFVPRIVLSSVHLPTFGRPMRGAKPDLISPPPARPPGRARVWGGRSTAGARALVGVASAAGGATHYLREEDAEDVAAPARPDAGDGAYPAPAREVDDLAARPRLVTRDHVGSRPHHLARDGVAEV